MKVSIVQTGGFAGLTVKLLELDTEKTDPHTAEKVISRVERLDFFKLPAVISTNHVGADFLNYTISISSGDLEHSVSLVDDENPTNAPLKDFLHYLQSLA
jgi:hypothetical protein